eukprot:SAG11_NODE_15593_length_572_cov_3.828753_1_plen_125_part_00
MGSEAPTDSGRQGADGARGSIVGDAGGGSAAGVDNSGAPEDPAFVEEAGEAEEEMWTRALAALDEDENLELERVELDELMRERASLHTIPEDLDIENACARTLNMTLVRGRLRTMLSLEGNKQQ